MLGSLRLQQIPVLTKIDLPTSDPELSLKQMEAAFGGCCNPTPTALGVRSARTCLRDSDGVLCAIPGTRHVVLC